MTWEIKCVPWNFFVLLLWAPYISSSRLSSLLGKHLENDLSVLLLASLSFLKKITIKYVLEQLHF